VVQLFWYFSLTPRLLGLREETVQQLRIKSMKIQSLQPPWGPRLPSLLPLSALIPTAISGLPSISPPVAVDVSYPYPFWAPALSTQCLQDIFTQVNVP
jgi:hypothetical protein